jgi:SAP domain-containing new25/Domain of unknown function (DUF6434)
MASSDGKEAAGRKPKLEPEMSVADFTDYYWLKADLVNFAKKLGLPTHGYKPELSARIERRLRGLKDLPDSRPQKAQGPRDSDKPLRRDTPVVNYKSDAKTRAFFKSQIGPEFHFTYHVNQFRLRNDNLTYGDLVDEWIAERDRRKSEDYQAPLAAHGKYNRYVRDFFADRYNKGKSFQDAVASWNSIKNSRGDSRYRPRKK